MNSLSSINLSGQRTNAEGTSARMNWLDWMKAIGIGLIVYGHFFSIGDTYVYVFSVPLFFLISGFLCRRESDKKIFWKKLWYNLFVPLIIICTINYLVDSAKGYFWPDRYAMPGNPLSFYAKLLIGIHKPLGAFWFVYTLIILKIILQYTRKNYLHAVWFVLFLLLAYIINNYDIELMGKHPFRIPWSIPNALVAYPFFIIGYFLRTWKENLSRYAANRYTVCWIVLSLLVVYLCGHNHNYVFLYECGYGDNIILCLVGALAGSAFIYLLCKSLERLHWSIITDISVGTTLILGFHTHIIYVIRDYFTTASIADLVFSAIIVLLFVPVIRFCKSHVPIIMGKYRVKK